MTRRLGKAPRPCSPPGTEKSTPRTHQKRHLHLTNNIHVKNHIHMQRSHSRMLDQRRTPHHLPLRRELTAVRKVKALQDPSTSSSFSPVSACSSVTRHETSNAGAQLDELQAHEKARRQARRRIARETEQAGMGNVERSHGHGYRDARNRRRDADEYAALAQWSDRLRDHQLFSKSQHQREPPPWSAGYRGEERWQGDAEEIARRLIAEQSGQIPSPAHSYMSNLARAHGLSLLGFRDDITTSEAEGSFLESEDGLAGVSSSHLSNSAGSPLVRSHRTRRRPLPNGNGNRAGALHSRRRAVHGYKEAPVVPTISDELDVSEIPQNGCGMPWYWTSGANKYKGKSLLDYANLGLTCAFPETALKKKTGDSKQVSRASSRHGSQRDLQVPIDAESHAVPLLNEAHEDEVDDAPARETPASAREKSPRPSQARDALETSTSKIPSPFTRSVSQKYKPKSFRDMVGQPLVVKSLTTAITKGKVAPVYLFTGPRGTGKTTCARVFAAALVCLNTEPHRRPCGLCRECATITLNRSRDVKEVDIGRFASLDNIKSSLSLSASNARQQVVIVEGCDALSVEVWTSFLKFLDDPPRGIVFILITSDGLERLPLSATSRCQKYHFGKLKESEIAARLQALAEKENLDVDEAVLRLISSRADGSLRDAESMLDQLSLLDQTITLSMVQELSGLIPDEKLVDLLDMALAADTVNTVKGMRALLDAGIDALSLVAQLASLITNILAGTFDLRREARKKGFFSRSMPRPEEQQRLRQALKVLAECEKQLRASNDRPTWLTAALLQFAPDRSYLPSSVDTSMAPSPIAFDTFERVPSGEPCTPRLPPLQPAGTESRSARKHSQSSPSDISSGFPRPGQGHRDKDKTPAVASPAAKVHPSGTESASDQAEGRSRRPTGSLVLFDPARAVGNRDFRVLPRRDMEDIWGKVLDGCRSNVLRQLLSSQGTLMALAVARDETFAVAHVEFRSPEHKARAERLRSSTCHAFQMALGCPVELKLSLECPPSVVLEEIKASNVVTLSVPSTSETANARAFGDAEDVDPSTESPPDEALPRHRRRKPKSRQEMLTGLAARSRRLGDAGSRASLDSRDGNIIGNKYCFPMECVSRDAAGSSRRHRLGRRPSLNRVPSGRRETLDGSGAKRVSVRWKYPKFKGIANLERRRTRRLDPRRKRTRAALCWQSPISETGQQEQLQTRRHPEPEQRKVTFFLRLVPCGRSTQTHGSPSRP